MIPMVKMEDIFDYHDIYVNSIIRINLIGYRH